MNTVTLAIGICLGEDQVLELDAFAQACGAEAAYVSLLVDEGLLDPVPDATGWCFRGEQIARVRRIRRLQRDFEANLQSVAVMLDLLNEVERLRRRLHLAGLDDADGAGADIP